MDEVSLTAAEAMLTTPARHPLSVTVGEIWDFFRDDHVHAALIVSPAGYLEAVVERDDIAECQALDAAAAPLGRLAGRTVPAGASLAEVHRAMIATGRRRAAVTSVDGRLLGLLCLKASQTGFCSEQDVRARALGRADPGNAPAFCDAKVEIEPAPANRQQRTTAALERHQQEGRAVVGAYGETAGFAANRAC